MTKLPFLIRCFLKFESILNTIGNVIRISAYRHLFSAKIGKDINLSNLRINWPQQLVLGNGSRLGREVDIVVDGPSGYPGKVTIGDQVEIVGTVRIKKKDDNNITIGTGCFIGYGVEINVSRDLTIGKDVLIAAGVKITDANHDYHQTALPRIKYPKFESVFIEDEVWIGSNAVILPGVHISRGAVVAAGSIVTRSIPAWELWAGVPARRIKSILQ